MLSNMQTIVLPPSARDGETESDSAVIPTICDARRGSARTVTPRSGGNRLEIYRSLFRDPPVRLQRECASAEDSVDARLSGQHFSGVRGA